MPCKGKAPVITGWQQFGQRMPTSEEQADWMARYPDANIGLPLGSQSGLSAIDIDTTDAKLDAAIRAQLPVAPYERIGRKGAGLLYKWKGQKNFKIKGLEGMIVEMLGQGNQIILPPSVHPETGQPYYANVHLSDVLADIPELPLGIEDRLRSAVPGTKNVLDQLVAKMARAPEGCRNDTLNKVAFEAGQLAMAVGLDVDEARRRLHAAAIAVGMDAGEIVATFESGWASGLLTPKGNKSVSQNDVAQEFAASSLGNWIFNHTVGKWLCWDGQRYAQDETGIARNAVRELAVQLGGGRPQSSSRGFVQGAEGFARDLPEIAVTAAALDAWPFLLATPAGTVDLKSGKLREAAREDRLTLMAGFAPEEGTPTLWLHFLDEALSGDRETIRFLQKWCGYCLTGDTTEQAMVFLYGAGGNGKSVFINVLASILGDFARTASMDTFTAAKGERHSTSLAMLHGARLVSASETGQGQQWDEVRVKAVTGGEPITARFMRQDDFTYRPTFKLLVASNHLPRLSDCGEAMRRRLNIVPFTVKPAQPDFRLEEKLRAESGKIFQWMIEGCMVWQREGLGKPASVRTATSDYFAEQDSFGTWLLEDCRIAAGLSEASSSLFACWSEFARGRGEDPGSAVAFASRMSAAGFSKARRSGGVFWVGVCREGIAANGPVLRVV